MGVGLGVVVVAVAAELGVGAVAAVVAAAQIRGQRGRRVWVVLALGIQRLDMT